MQAALQLHPNVPRPRIETWQVDSYWRMVAKAITLFDATNDEATLDTGYVAVAMGKSFDEFMVGKPKRKSNETEDYTNLGGGPYIVNIVNKTCNCPAFAGCSKTVIKNDVELTQHMAGKGWCKHLTGLLHALETRDYKLVLIKNSSRYNVRWEARKNG